ncbi:hypothetical protein [Virgibacillus proomii]|uniref:hypothetical protein n=1 Tax=Virgibacillus proomii TaxID=84407 RepID=UPI001C113F1C|nr:hypothetical protein [Virgibacillus proomii]MBU5266889.1 hypothetical protein [Virgibacillus proomii]
MHKKFQKKLVWLIILICLQITFIFLSNKIEINNQIYNNLLFITATLIISMTIYIILTIIISKFPSFLEDGIWKKPFFTLLIGTFALLILSVLILFIFNNLNTNPTMTRSLTFIMGYPITFVLILMIESFFRKLLNTHNREKVLFYSSISIVLSLTLIILVGKLNNI